MGELGGWRGGVVRGMRGVGGGRVVLFVLVRYCK